MGVPADFDVLVANHKTTSQIKSSVGGAVGKAIKEYDWETCSISLSYALNKAGAVIADNYAYEDKRVATGKVRAKKGGDNNNYIYSVLDMKVYLDKRYGIAENYKGTKEQMKAKIKGRNGIIYRDKKKVIAWTESITGGGFKGDAANRLFKKFLKDIEKSQKDIKK